MQNSKFNPFEKLRTRIQNSRNKGFSLSIFLFVMGIISVTSILLINIFDPYDKYLAMQDDKRKSDLRNLQQIMEKFKDKYNRYPRSVNYRVMGTEWGYYWESEKRILPKDPSYPEKWYIYQTDKTAQMYWLYASLSRENKDKSVCTNTLMEESIQCDNVPKDTSGSYIRCGNKGEICNFGLSSQNSSP